MPDENDEFKDDLKQFLSQPDDNDHIDWIEGNRSGATDRLPVQGEEQISAMTSETMSGIPIPQAATRAALEQILKYAGDKVSTVVVAAILLGLLTLAGANAFRLWLIGEEKKK